MNPNPFLSRRQALQQLACGFGYMAFAGLAAQGAARSTANPLVAKAGHLRPRAKRVIFLFMGGGVSHLDSFDYKPKLYEHDGKMMDFLDQRAIAKTGVGATGRVMKPMWDFKQRGQSGRWVSDLFPHMAELADDYCVVRSMHTEGVAHGPATLFLHTGSTNLIRPSMGSWVTYGLGSESENLPAFVSLSPTLANGGPRNYGSAFLPAVYQGTAIGRAGQKAIEAGLRNVRNPSLTAAEQQRQFELVRALNEEQLRAKPGDYELEAVANSYELAWRLQNHAPDALDLTKESAATLALYGIGEEPTDDYGRQCLQARRLAESGVRYIQVNYSDNTNNPAWDQHSNLPTPSCGGAANLAARPTPRKTVRAATTTPPDFRWCSLAAASSLASRMARRMTSVTSRSRTRSTCTTSTRRSSTSSASITRSSPSATTAAISGSPMCAGTSSTTSLFDR